MNFTHLNNESLTEEGSNSDISDSEVGNLYVREVVSGNTYWHHIKRRRSDWYRRSGNSRTGKDSSIFPNMKFCDDEPLMTGNGNRILNHPHEFGLSCDNLQHNYARPHRSTDGVSKTSSSNHDAINSLNTQLSGLDKTTIKHRANRPAVSGALGRRNSLKNCYNPLYYWRRRRQRMDSSCRRRDQSKSNTSINLTPLNERSRINLQNDDINSIHSPDRNSNQSPVLDANINTNVDTTTEVIITGESTSRTSYICNTTENDSRNMLNMMNQTYESKRNNLKTEKHCYGLSYPDHLYCKHHRSINWEQFKK